MLNRLEKLVGFVWSIANESRGADLACQYFRVRLLMIISRCMDCALILSKKKMLVEYEKLKVRVNSEGAITKILGQTAGRGRGQLLYNISQYYSQKLLGSLNNNARNLIVHIDSFSPKEKETFSRFELEQEIIFPLARVMA